MGVLENPWLPVQKDLELEIGTRPDGFPLVQKSSPNFYRNRNEHVWFQLPWSHVRAANDDFSFAVRGAIVTLISLIKIYN